MGIRSIESLPGWGWEFMRASNFRHRGWRRKKRRETTSLKGKNINQGAGNSIKFPHARWIRKGHVSIIWRESRIIFMMIERESWRIKRELDRQKPICIPSLVQFKDDKRNRRGNWRVAIHGCPYSDHPNKWLRCIWTSIKRTNLRSKLNN